MQPTNPNQFTEKAWEAIAAGNWLETMLPQGELRCIGATTLDESRKSVSRDEVTEADIVEIISQWKGIPISELVES